MGDPEGFASDPPILVGGGGSTLIWVRKDFEPEVIEDYHKVKNTAKLQHPENYRIYRYENLEITGSTVRAKEGEHCKHDKLSKEHLTWFD